MAQPKRGKNCSSFRNIQQGSPPKDLLAYRSFHPRTVCATNCQCQTMAPQRRHFSAPLLCSRCSSRTRASRLSATCGSFRANIFKDECRGAVIVLNRSAHACLSYGRHSDLLFGLRVNIGGAAALVTFGGNDLVVVLPKVHPL